MSKKISELCVSAILVLSISLAVEAQFFTKPSSKSIPRMGRSSQGSLFESDKYRQFLINELLDNYGPNLMEALLREQKMDRMKNKHHDSSSYQTVSSLDFDTYSNDSEAENGGESPLQELSSGGLGEMLERVARRQ